MRDDKTFKHIKEERDNIRIKMSMYQFQRNFEQSLRTPNYKSSLIHQTPLKTEIHKGCTGKAHACGTLKNAKAAAVAAALEKNQRKNSLSSETISDSGSEVSSLNSGLNERLNSTESNDSITTSVGGGGGGGGNKKNKIVRRTSSMRRKTADNFITQDEVDKLCKNVNGNKMIRPRLYSDGDTTIDNNIKSKLQQSQSFRLHRKLSSSNQNGNSPPVKPPWRGTKSVSPATLETPIKPIINRNASFNGNSNLTNNRVRSSFRRRVDSVQWDSVWEKSFSQKSDGGMLKSLDKIISDSKVNIIKFIISNYYFYIN